jgi:hypothetical protein
MGLFNFFKKNKQNAASNELKELFAKMQSEMFPNGETDIRTGTKELLRILNYNYAVDENTARTIFMRSSSICYTTSMKGQFSKERLKQHLAPYALKYFNENSLNEFYDYLLSKNEKAALTDMLRMFSQQTNSEGTDQDEMPEGYGEFGLEITNPIPAASIPDSYYYLDNLKTVSGGKITYDRIGSMQAPNINATIDGYRIFSNGSQIATIYICPYNKKTSAKAPKGFKLK